MSENPRKPDEKDVKVVLTPEDRQEVMSTVQGQPDSRPSPERSQVHVAGNLLDIATGRVETAQEQQDVREQHNLNEAVHAVLIIGLAISTILMLIGIVQGLVIGSPLPAVEPAPGQIIQRIVELRPSGFMGLGLLVLLATPILRVIGSVVAFAYERDWRFAGITFLVFMIVMTSIFLGKG